MPRMTETMRLESREAGREYARRYPLGTLLDECVELPDGSHVRISFYAHYKRGHGRRAVMLRRAFFGRDAKIWKG